jgi:hypothetical protein
MTATVIAFRPRAAAVDDLADDSLFLFSPLADCVPVPLPACPPITREHRLEAALLIVQSDLEAIERALNIEPDSTPLHVPPRVAEALYRSMRTIANGIKT